jgi:hypothetical protein
MRIHVRAIKQLYDNEYSIDALMQFSSIDEMNTCFEEYKILAISKEPFNADPATFATVYGSFYWNGSNHDIVIRNMTIQDSVRTLLFLGLDVRAINSYTQALDVSEAVTVIQQLQDEVTTILEQKKSAIQSQISAAESHYDDAQTDKIQTFVTRVLQDSDYAIKKYTQLPDLAKKISTQVQDLKKMRLSKNADKLKEVIYTIYAHIDQMEQAYLQTLPNDPIDPVSTIKTPIFVRLYDKRHRTQQLQSIWFQLPIQERLYALLGKHMMSARFLLTDIGTNITQRREKPVQVCLDMTFVIACCIVSVTVAGYSIALFGWNSIESMIGQWLVFLGISGVSLQAGCLLSKKTLRHTMTILLISIIILLCLHYISRRFLILNG